QELGYRRMRLPPDEHRRLTYATPLELRFEPGTPLAVADKEETDITPRRGHPLDDFGETLHALPAVHGADEAGHPRGQSEPLAHRRAAPLLGVEVDGVDRVVRHRDPLRPNALLLQHRPLHLGYGDDRVGPTHGETLRE